VLPHIAGRGWIHGMHRIGPGSGDPYRQGYLLSDRSGEAFDLSR